MIASRNFSRASSITFLIFVNLSFSTAQDFPSNNVEQISISPGESDVLDLKSVFDKITFVKLEISSDQPIGHIDRVLCIDDLLIITDKKAKVLFLYNKNGKYLNHLAASGRGPGEFINLKDVALNYTDKELHIYDRAQKKIIVYDLKGDFIREVPIKPYFNQFCVGNKNNYFLFVGTEFDDSNYKHLILKFSPEGVEIERFLEYPNNQIATTALPLHFVISNEVKSFATTTTNYVYTISNQRVAPKYMLDFGAHTKPHDLINSKKALDEMMSKDYVTPFLYFQENDDYLFSWYACKSYNPAGFLYSKQSKKVINFKMLKNFLDYQGYNILIPLGIFEDQLIYPVDPGHLNDLIEAKKLDNDLFGEVQHLLPLNIEDNPVLAFYKIKSF